MVKPEILLVFSCFLISMVIVAQPVTRNTYTTQVLVAGGGASGIAAALQAARMDVSVILVEETPWLGGMLTAAGVSATDGNHKLPSGIWGEFRQRLYDHYGGPQKLATGWVSNTQFEPVVGNAIFQEMADKLPNLRRFHGFYPVEVRKKKQKVTGVVFENERKERLEINAGITIDATELGDVMAMAGCAYRVGQDARSESGESNAVEKVDEANIQDLTYSAILKDYGAGKAPRVKLPDGFDLSQFDCTCKENCESPGNATHDAGRMITYGKLPNGKYMINWPEKGNDTYLNIIGLSNTERKQALIKAKETTLAFVYLLQTKLGFDRLGLSDEFGTSDSLPWIAYHRESRRVKGLSFLTENDLADSYNISGPRLYRQGIAVGNYPLDHHHKKNPAGITEAGYYKIPPFTIPYGSLVPEKVDGLLVAEKSISVSHMVNGSSRLQPIVLCIGQAAGAAAAMAVVKRIPPRRINIRQLQDQLLRSGAYIYPVVDMLPQDSFFTSMQHACAMGWIRPEFKVNGWANEMYCYPDSIINTALLNTILGRISPGWSRAAGSSVTVTAGDIAAALMQIRYKRTGIKKITRADPFGYLVKKDIFPVHSKRSDVWTIKQLILATDKLFLPFSQPLYPE